MPDSYTSLSKQDCSHSMDQARGVMPQEEINSEQQLGLVSKSLL